MPEFLRQLPLVKSTNILPLLSRVPRAGVDSRLPLPALVEVQREVDTVGALVYLDSFRQLLDELRS